jgi:hypothetical protein
VVIPVCGEGPVIISVTKDKVSGVKEPKNVKQWGITNGITNKKKKIYYQINRERTIRINLPKAYLLINLQI